MDETSGHGGRSPACPERNTPGAAERWKGCHPLLRRQIKRHLGENVQAGPEWAAMLRAVSEAYFQSDTDRNLLERSLDLSSQELLQANADMRATLKAFPDLFFRIDLDGTIRDCKASVDEDLLASPRQLIGRKIQDVPDSAVARQFEDALQEMASTRRLQSLEYSLPAGRGRTWFEARLVPLGRDETVAIIRNITERHRTEEALKQKDEELRQSQKMEAIGRLAGGLAHDFNNLLTVVHGHGELLREMVDAEAQPFVTHVINAASRASGLTRQLLAFSRQQVLQPKVLDVNRVVSNIEGMLSRLIGDDIEIRTSLRADVGHVLADPTQLEQVVLNLALNARDAMPNGGRVTIATDIFEFGSGAAAGAGVLLQVSDTGTGMDRETAARVFEPFFTTKEPGQGNGLGLATVHGIVNQSGGTIEVDSEPGRGTRFRIILPRVQAVTDAEPDPVAVTPLGLGARILVVEDEPSVRSLLAASLPRLGYQVLEACGGKQAIALATGSADSIQVLLCDIAMPGMSGYEVARAVRSIRPDIRVVFMSGNADQAACDAALGEPTTLLHKPFARDVLAVALREALLQPAAPALP